MYIEPILLNTCTYMSIHNSLSSYNLQCILITVRYVPQLHTYVCCKYFLRIKGKQEYCAVHYLMINGCVEVHRYILELVSHG